MKKYKVVLIERQAGQILREVTLRTYDDPQRAQAEAGNLRRGMKQKPGKQRLIEVK